MLLRTYKKLMDLSPRVKKIRGVCYKLERGIILEGKANEVVFKSARSLANTVKRFPFDVPVKFLVFSMRDDPPPPQVYDDEENRNKNAFLREEFEKLKRRTVFRKRDRFLIVEEEGKQVVEELNSLPFLKFILDEDHKSLNKALAYFFGGTEEDPIWYPIEGWEYGVKIGDKWGAVLMDLKVPAELNAFVMDFLNHLNLDYIFCMNFRIPPPFEVEKNLSAMRSLVAKQAANDPASREILQEIVSIQKELELEREKLVFTTTTLTVFADTPEEALKRAKEVSRKFAQVGLKFESEGTIEFEAFSQLFEWDEKFCSSMKLVRTYISDAFAQMLPVSTLIKGAKPGTGALFFNNGQEAVYLNLYEVLPPNMTVLGQMGAGKSVFLSYMGTAVDMITYLEKIQEGEGSYKNLVEFFGGVYHPIAKARPKSLAPFGNTIMSIDEIAFVEDLGYSFEQFSDADLVLMREVLNHTFFERTPDVLTKEEIIRAFKEYPNTEFIVYQLENAKWKNDKWEVRYTEDKDKMSTLQTLFNLMLHLGGIEDVDPAELGEIIRTTYQRKAEQYNGVFAPRELLMRDFVETAQVLKKDKIATRLSAYTMKGVYGQFFDAPSRMLMKRHMFFELRDNDEELLPVAVMSILTNIVKYYSEPKHFHLKKGIALDEAWLFINHPLIVDWLEEGVRTYRKKGIFLVFASQLAKDFTAGAGEFLKGTSPYNVFLFSQEHSKIKEAFELTDGEYEILRTIKRPKDYGYKYSKFYCITPYREGEERGTLYFVPSRVFYWLTTTDPQDRKKREIYKNKYKDMFTAIRKLAEEDELKV